MEKFTSKGQEIDFFCIDKYDPIKFINVLIPSFLFILISPTGAHFWRPL
ncbi:hypothetical protein BN2497_333 [Janthinobacterium sp. CG23_2]|nr:hypothetical protein BN2497_333 [Janthinobacterium sp. CG23_2]CUU26564.1 hypothetical protein BN3177_333 [Janthinobacterium sp. CG23_2]